MIRKRMKEIERLKKSLNENWRNSLLLCNNSMGMISCNQKRLFQILLINKKNKKKIKKIFNKRKKRINKEMMKK